MVIWDSYLSLFSHLQPTCAQLQSSLGAPSSLPILFLKYLLSLHHLTKFYCPSKALSKRSPDKPLYFPFSCPHSTWGGPLGHASRSHFTSKEAWMRKAWQYRDTLGSDAAEVNVDRAWDTMQGKDPCTSKGRTMWTCTGKWVVSVTIQIWTLTIWDWASRVTKHSGTGGRWVVQSKEQVPPGWTQLPPEGPIQTKAGLQTQNQRPSLSSRKKCGFKVLHNTKNRKESTNHCLFIYFKHFQVYYNQRTTQTLPLPLQSR